MRGKWAIATVLTCMLVGVFGLAANMPGEGASIENGSQQPSAVRTEFDPGTDSAAPEPVGAAQPALTRSAIGTSTATRHVPTREESALTGAMHPATDQVMVLLIGWVLLALLGGGLLAPRH